MRFDTSHDDIHYKIHFLAHSVVVGFALNRVQLSRAGRMTYLRDKPTVLFLQCTNRPEPRYFSRRHVNTFVSCEHAIAVSSPYTLLR